MVAQPLTELLKKDAFVWDSNTQQAFEQLKLAMTQAPVLAMPNFNEEFVIETDASSIGMGAVLTQNHHPICFFSKKFCNKLLNSSTYVRELCVITSTVKKWTTYLLGRKFIVLTDQRSLRELMTQVIQAPEQQYYLAKLLGYFYEIRYKPGAQNRVADALSRIHDTFPTLMALTVPHWEFLEKLRETYTTDIIAKEQLHKVMENSEAFPSF